MFVLGYYVPCPDGSICILIKTEKLSFSEMLRRELYLWPFAKKLYHGWISTMTPSNEKSWKLPPPKWEAGCTPVSGELVHVRTKQMSKWAAIGAKYDYFLMSTENNRLCCFTFVEYFTHCCFSCLQICLNTWLQLGRRNYAVYQGNPKFVVHFFGQIRPSALDVIKLKVQLRKCRA